MCDVQGMNKFTIDELKKKMKREKEEAEAAEAAETAKWAKVHEQLKLKTY